MLQKILEFIKIHIFKSPANTELQQLEENIKYFYF